MLMNDFDKIFKLGSYNFFLKTKFKGALCRFENLPLYSNSYKNNTLKNSDPQS